MEVRQLEGLPEGQGERRRASDLGSKGKDDGSIKTGEGSCVLEAGWSAEDLSHLPVRSSDWVLSLVGLPLPAQRRS